ncbi:MAG: S1 RNA-binding domain-containing protein [archaeon]
MEYPKLNDVVVCKITKITDFGVFANILEFDNIEGFIHISQVSSTWIKNIHNHVKIGQIKAAKVLKIDEEKSHIDLSFSRVTPADEKRKISDYRLFLRAQSLMEVIAKELGLTSESVWEKIGDPILEKEPSLYKGFINLLKYGKDYYPEIEDAYRQTLFDLLSKNITVKDKIITGMIKVSSTEANGIEIIRKALLKLQKDYPNSKFNYVGPGRYSITVVAKDYKIASKDFDLISKDITKSLKGEEVEIIKNDSD